LARPDALPIWPAAGSQAGPGGHHRAGGPEHRTSRGDRRLRLSLQSRTGQGPWSPGRVRHRPGEGVAERMPAGRVNRLLVLAPLAVAGAALLSVPMWASSYMLHVAVVSLYYIVLTSSWNLLAGF